MNTFFGLTLTILAAYRLTRFIMADTWPPVQTLRDYLMRRWDSRWYEGITCPWCMGFWVAAALVMGLAQVTHVPLPGLYALGVATGVGLLGRWDD